MRNGQIAQAFSFVDPHQGLSDVFVQINVHRLLSRTVSVHK